MLVHDTLSADKVELVPRELGKVALYICGPTVYDVPHVGHARSTLSFDAIRRALEWRGVDAPPPRHPPPRPAQKTQKNPARGGTATAGAAPPRADHPPPPPRPPRPPAP